MEQNLKELFEKDRSVNHPRRKDHEDLFIERLYEELPAKRKRIFGAVKIAASVILFVSLGLMSYLLINQDEELSKSEFTLSTIAPDLGEIEVYYIAQINNTLSEIKDSNKNQSMVDRYMKRFAILEMEHESLVTEINEEGPSSMSIQALINNLKKQLELLQALKTEMEAPKIENHEFI
jgi:hypothetical protein